VSRQFLSICRDFVLGAQISSSSLGRL
jgi:hypothetical protein